MKNVLIMAAVIAAVLLAGGVMAWKYFDAQTPESLLARLESGKGDRDELIMKLNVARGDVVGPMIAALSDPKRTAKFRAEMAELVAKRVARDNEPRLVAALDAATNDSEVQVRRRAVHCIALYSPEAQQGVLVDKVNDSDGEVRRSAYMVLAARARADAAKTGVWSDMTPEKRQQLADTCRRLMVEETDPELALLARSVVGRVIEIQCDEARQAQQSSDIARAEQMLRQAMELDPDNHQAKIRLARLLLETGDKDEAMALARQFGAVFDIPELTGEPAIDGDPDDAAWQGGAIIDQFYQGAARWCAMPPKGKSRAMVGHRGGKLYIAMIAWEDDLDLVTMGNTGRDSDVWRDDCMELIFDPGMTGRGMYQFVINAGNGLYDQADEDKGKNFQCEYRSGVFKDRGYWACEFAIDGAEMGKPIQAGTVWAMNLFRTRIGPASEQCGIWPTFGFSKRMDIYPLALFTGPKGQAAQAQATATSQPAPAASQPAAAQGHPADAATSQPASPTRPVAATPQPAGT